jgi:hypothetical protein
VFVCLVVLTFIDSFSLMCQFITGRGKHSSSGIPKIKRAVEDLVRSKSLQFSLVRDVGFVTVTRK